MRLDFFLLGVSAALGVIGVGLIAVGVANWLRTR